MTADDTPRDRSVRPALKATRRRGARPAGAWRAFDLTLQRVASSAARGPGAAPPTVLLTGESGTGKSRAARRLHDLSPRAAGPSSPSTSRGSRRRSWRRSSSGTRRVPSRAPRAPRRPVREGLGWDRRARGDRDPRPAPAGEAAEGPPGACGGASGRGAARPRRLRSGRHDRGRSPAGSGRGALPGGPLLPPRGRALEIPPLRAWSGDEDFAPLCDALVAAVAARASVPPRDLSTGARELLAAHPWPGTSASWRTPSSGSWWCPGGSDRGGRAGFPGGIDGRQVP